MILWFFGLPGVGKSTLAKRLSSLVSIPFIDLDNMLTDEEKGALCAGTFTSEMRLKKLTRAVTLIQATLANTAHMTTSDSLPDSRSRSYVAQALGEGVRFVLIRSPRIVHIERLTGRKNHFFTADLLKEYEKKHWSPPFDISYALFENNDESRTVCDKRLLELYTSLIHS